MYDTYLLLCVLLSTNTDNTRLGGCFIIDVVGGRYAYMPICCRWWCVVVWPNGFFGFTFGHLKCSTVWSFEILCIQQVLVLKYYTAAAVCRLHLVFNYIYASSKNNNRHPLYILHIANRRMHATIDLAYTATTRMDVDCRVCNHKENERYYSVLHFLFRARPLKKKKMMPGYQVHDSPVILHSPRFVLSHTVTNTPKNKREK